MLSSIADGACVSSCCHVNGGGSSSVCPLWPGPARPLTILNMCIVSCVYRQADIGPPIIGSSVVREKSLFIGPLSVFGFRDIFSSVLLIFVSEQADDDGEDTGGVCGYLTCTMDPELRCLHKAASLYLDCEVPVLHISHGKVKHRCVYLWFHENVLGTSHRGSALSCSCA